LRKGYFSLSQFHAIGFPIPIPNSIDIQTVVFTRSNSNSQFQPSLMTSKHSLRVFINGLKKPVEKRTACTVYCIQLLFIQRWGAGFTIGLWINRRWTGLNIPEFPLYVCIQRVYSAPMLILVHWCAYPPVTMIWIASYNDCNTPIAT
jgi:hypothetical protein